MTTSGDSGEDFDAASVFHRMERMMGGAVRGRKHEREAQDLVYDAWECPDANRACELLERAVELDPANVDAWLGLTEFTSIQTEEAIEILHRLVSMGEKNLGKRIFKQEKGQFWGLLETRPYMRARAQLASRLADAGRIEEALAEYEGILALNPNDNQGVRYELMACYLSARRMKDAGRLFDQYDERKHSAAFAWAYVLERYLSGDLEGARRAVADAREQNSYAMAYFLGHRKLPQAMPSAYAIGSREEAMVAWNILSSAWETHPQARTWLASERNKK